MNYLYKHAIIGGTFDHFHIGHQKLIDTAFKESERVTVGVSLEKLYKDKFLSAVIQDYKTRFQALKEYLEAKDYLSRAEIIALDDIYGNAIIEKNIDAIFVTKDTLRNAKKLNVARYKLGYEPLQIITIPFVKGSDEKKIKSERIRYGETDRQGTIFIDIFKNKEVFFLPKNLRDELRNPIGKILTQPQEVQIYRKNALMVISVGDICSLFLHKAGYTPDLSIIDFKTRREIIAKSDIVNFLSSKTEPIENSNRAGTISKKVVYSLKKAIKTFLEKKERQVIIINGEEDLLALPAVLFAPLGSVVFYGQFDRGTVVVPVTEEKKREISEILKRFE
jgi:GTP-dependent dephospho-CoA kinase